MKIIFKIVSIIGIILAVVVILLGGIFLYLSKRPNVPADYAKSIKSGGDIESKYLSSGKYEVSYFEQDAMENYKKYEIWYPKEMETSNKQYPVVVINNGTGVKASKCAALWEHLASWGFIVIANEEEYSWNGFAADMSLNFLLKSNENSESIFYQHIDTANIGVSGHSQGGVGTINTITNTQHANRYKAAFAASTTQEELSFALEWEYDASKINIPIFMVAGTGDLDVQTISPLAGMQQIFDKIKDAPIKVMARRTAADHGHMLTYANGYETAWFMWHLQGDEEASKAFIGQFPEIKSNEMYQDQNISGTDYSSLMTS